MFNTIKQTIDKFNDSHNNQVNLASPAARADLTTLIHNAIVKEMQSTETENTQQMYLFSNIEDCEHK
jgi:hypothetical protein